MIAESFTKFLDEKIHSYTRSIDDIKNNQNVVIWYGCDNGSILTLYFLCSILQECKLYGVDVSKYKPQATCGQLCSDEILDAVNLITPITEVDREKYAEKYENLHQHHKREILIAKDWIIVPGDKNTFKERIIKNVPKHGRKLLHVVGSAMMDSTTESYFGDCFYIHLVFELIVEGILEPFDIQTTSVDRLQPLDEFLNLHEDVIYDGVNLGKTYSFSVRLAK